MRANDNVPKVQGKRILVIDDDKASRDAFVLALEDTEYRVDTAESGAKGLEMKQSTGYDLIFIDLKMPEMNGVEVLRKIRKKDKTTPVYIITAFHKEFFDELKLAEADGVGFELLKKPIGSDRIVLLTKSILEKPAAY